MASAKEYGYFIKGNKLALIEKDTALDNDVNSRDYGPDVTNVRFKSPQSSVTNGIELEYVRTPNYTLTTTGTEGTDFHRFIGWGSDGTNLLLFTFSGASTVVDLSSLFAADDNIVISGSSRWNGLHQVSSTGGSTGILTLKTKVNLRPAKITVTGTFEADDETFIGDSAAHIVDIETFKDVINSRRTSPHIFIDNAAHGNNHGLFSLTSNETSGKITLANKISIDTDGDYTSTAAANAAASSDAVSLYNVFYEQISVYEGVEVLSGASAETYELDLTRYQANAVVYYLKAKLAEDMGDMEQREFFLREFKRQLEKGNSALKRGPYIVQGFKEMRN